MTLDELLSRLFSEWLPALPADTDQKLFALLAYRLRRAGISHAHLLHLIAVAEEA